MDKTNYYVITHTDLDGIGCEILAKAFLTGEDKSLVSVVNTQPGFKLDSEVYKFLDLLNDPRSTGWYVTYHLIITDLCPSRDVMDKLNLFTEINHEFLHVTVLDHHTRPDMEDFVPNAKGSMEYIGQPTFTDNELTIRSSHPLYPVYNNGLSSGTFRFHMYIIDTMHICLNNPLLATLFSEAVRAYDTWDWKAENYSEHYKVTSVKLEKLLHIDQNFVDRYVNKLSVCGSIIDGSTMFSDIDTILIDAQIYLENKAIMSTISHPLYAEVKGKKALIFTVTGYTSQICNYVFEHVNDLELSEFDFIMTMNPVTLACSLRTNHDDVSVRDIAAKFGGGGHPKASGFSFNDFDVYAEFRKGLLLGLFA